MSSKPFGPLTYLNWIRLHYFFNQQIICLFDMRIAQKFLKDNPYPNTKTTRIPNVFARFIFTYSDEEHSDILSPNIILEEKKTFSRFNVACPENFWTFRLISLAVAVSCLLGCSASWARFKSATLFWLLLISWDLLRKILKVHFTKLN